MPADSQPFLIVQDYEAFGELVEEWAKGTEVRPKTIKGLVKLLNDRGIGPVVPKSWDLNKPAPALKFFDLPDGCVNIVVPSVSMIEKGTQAVKALASYRFPGEYDDAYGGVVPVQLSEDERDRVRQARLADYCISICM